METVRGVGATVTTGFPDGATIVAVLDALPTDAARRHPESEPHTHDEPILAWSDTATAVISCTGRDWVVSPGFGMWLPALASHSVRLLRVGVGSALLFDPDRCPLDWHRPTAVRITPLLRELAAHLDRLGDAGPGARARAEAVLLDALEPMPATSIPLPVPTDDRLLAITDALLRNPADDRDLAAWAFAVGAGARTLSRLFVTETGMTFAQWRTRARIHAAVALLAGGAPVAVVGRRVGFTKPAAFSEAFRRVTGHRPSGVRELARSGGAAPASIELGTRR